MGHILGFCLYIFGIVSLFLFQMIGQGGIKLGGWCSVRLYWLPNHTNRF